MAAARDGSTPAVLLAPSQLFNCPGRTTGTCSLRAASPAASAAARPADDAPRLPCLTTAPEECSGCTCQQFTRTIASWPSGRTVPTSQAQRNGCATCTSSWRRRRAVPTHTANFSINTFLVHSRQTHISGRNPVHGRFARVIGGRIRRTSDQRYLSRPAVATCSRPDCARGQRSTAHRER